MGERTINVNAEWYETVTAELKAKDKRIDELEAKRDQWRIAGEFWHKKHTTLEDGLHKKMTRWTNDEVHWIDCVEDVRELLGKENDDE